MENTTTKSIDIFSFVHTKEDAIKIDEQIDVVLARIYQGQTSLPVLLNDTFPLPLAEYFMQHITQLGAESSNPSVINSYFSQIKSLLLTATYVRITLAFEAEPSFYANVSQTLKGQLGTTNVLLDTTFDKQIRGGIIFIIDGRVYDYSLEKQLQRSFEQKSQQITALLT